MSELLDADLERFLCACGIEPTPEAMAVSRRLWDIGHLVVAQTDGHPDLSGYRKIAEVRARNWGSVPSLRISPAELAQAARGRRP